jgi:hypothetical protein
MRYLIETGNTVWDSGEAVQAFPMRRWRRDAVTRPDPQLCKTAPHNRGAHATGSGFFTVFGARSCAVRHWVEQMVLISDDCGQWYAE